MSILFDLMLSLILAVCAFIGYKRGLIHTLSKFISYLLSFTFANQLYVFLARPIMKLFFAETSSMINEVPFSERMTFLDRLRDSFELIKENAILVGDAETMERAKLLTDYGVAVLLSSFAAFVLTFVLSYFLMKLFIYLMNGLITKIAVLKQINGVLGGVFGLLNGFFWTWAITGVFARFILPTLTEKWPSVFVAEISNSVIIQLCTKINPITYLIEFINFIFH